MAASVLLITQVYKDPSYNEPEYTSVRVHDRAISSSFDRMLADWYTPTPTVTNTPTPISTATAIPTSIPGVQPHTVAPRAGSDVTTLQKLICSSEFTWLCEWAFAVVECESTWDPNAQGVEWNPTSQRWLHFNGLFQVLGGSFDPYTNTVQAHIQYVEWQQGIRLVSPWPNCS